MLKVVEMFVVRALRAEGAECCKAGRRSLASRTRLKPAALRGGAGDVGSVLIWVSFA